MTDTELANNLRTWVVTHPFMGGLLEAHPFMGGLLEAADRLETQAEQIRVLTETITELAERSRNLEHECARLARLTERIG